MLNSESYFEEARFLMSAMKALCIKQESDTASVPKGILHLLGQHLEGLFCPPLYLQCLKQCLHIGTQ